MKSKITEERSTMTSREERGDTGAQRQTNENKQKRAKN